MLGKPVKIVLRSNSGSCNRSGIKERHRKVFLLHMYYSCNRIPVIVLFLVIIFSCLGCFVVFSFPGALAFA